MKKVKWTKMIKIYIAIFCFSFFMLFMGMGMFGAYDDSGCSVHYIGFKKAIQINLANSTLIAFLLTLRYYKKWIILKENN